MKRALLCVVLASCARTESPASTGGEGSTPTVAVGCSSDDECVWARGCCPGCAHFSGRSPTSPVTTRAEADEAARKCEAEARDCPRVDCVSPPPCRLELEPACVAGTCVVRAGAPECPADACGPPPTLGDRECDSYRVALYERCTCLASGAERCDPAIWRALCPHPARCEPAQPPPALAAARVECAP
jgi:hypothetical protein